MIYGFTRTQWEKTISPGPLTHQYTYKGYDQPTHSYTYNANKFINHIYYNLLKKMTSLFTYYEHMV